MPDRSPQTLWETALGQLELQVTRPNFETWLRNTVGLRIEDGQLTVGVSSDFAIEWLRSRMHGLICRTVSQLLGSSVSISFEVLGVQPLSVPMSENGRRPARLADLSPRNLNPRLTFESFITVKSNRLAYRAARRIASGDCSYNPLVLFGAPGLGKTHLLHAIGHEAAAPDIQVILLTAQEFVDRYARATRAKRPHTFPDTFQDCSLLLLDDLSFLSTRLASQEQFFHIFNTLHSRGCRLVVTIDAHPDAVAGLSPRLRSRLQAGLCAELPSPCSNELLDILHAKAAHLRQPLPESVLQFIAKLPLKSIHDLEGALNRISAYVDLADTPLTIDMAIQALHPLRLSQQQPSPDTILDLVCQHFHLSLNQLTGPSRARDITYARHIAMYLLREHGPHPLAEIGRFLGGRDHSTVLNAYQRIKQEIASFPQTQTNIQQLEAALQNTPAA